MRDTNTRPAALQGLKVVECATVVAGPLCGRLFGDFGADVIHIEHPKKGDPLRDFGFTVDGINPWWKYYDRNKKLVTLDISRPKGRAILFDILKDADIFIENFRPGRLEEWNILYEDLAAINPRLIMIRVTGYGQTGPYSSQPGFGTIAEAMSGFAEMTGDPDGAPMLPQFPLADSCAGFSATMAAMFAVYHRDVVGTGKGQVIDVSIWESLFSILGPNALVNHVTGRSPRRIGNRAPTSAPRNTYRTSDDRWIAIASATQTTARRMFELMGMPDLIRDPRFDSNSNRVRNVVALDELVTAWVARYTREEISKILYEAEVPFGPINNVADIMADPHARAREMVIEHVDTDGRTLRMEGVFPKMSETPGAVRSVGGALGRDNAEVFGLLGLTPEQIGDLSKEGII